MSTITRHCYSTKIIQKPSCVMICQRSYLSLLERPGLQSSVSANAGDAINGMQGSKKGKRVWGCIRLCTNSSQLALLSILLTNVFSLVINWSTSNTFRLLETTVFLGRLAPVPDADAIQLDQLASFCAKKNAALCSKACISVLCVYINMKWCKNSVVVARLLVGGVCDCQIQTGLFILGIHHCPYNQSLHSPKN